MKTILVPTDLSAASEAALSVAVEIARTYQSTILLLHSVVYPLPVAAYPEAVSITTSYTVDEWRQLEQEAKIALNRLVANEKYKGVTIVPTLLTNGQGLIHNVTDRPADLIVMSSEGASGLEEWLVGSNAESIVRHAHCPVLIIKKPVVPFRPEKIVYAIDVDDRLKAVQPYSFPLSEGKKYQFLYVQTPTDSRVPEGIRDWINEFARAEGITEFTATVYKSRDVSGGILDYADEANADLIVLVTHGYKGLRHFLSGSVAEDVLNHSQKPVLVMRI
ncbi:universal stress protein [Spirosoma radiotolerans]|uniref:Universal stress protein UspA n=1 Tax=Spirosoma radiotolerans TaxID=1379870 RepID=A0A0E3VAI2_9BACT|nr:universal stress protein [Spirosoma radiotolerans]AKD58121.1 universal stress protein UspA [Spirosoma radiotolerans]